VAESLTRRVAIEHLSENSLGSLLPSSVYLRLKALIGRGSGYRRPADRVSNRCRDGTPDKTGGRRTSALHAATCGPCSEIITIFKFRSMRCDASPGNAFTQEDNPRVTSIGRLLRRYSIDELPQLWNIMKGEMSWIGPLPNPSSFQII
jgi:hypothetical protein